MEIYFKNIALLLFLLIFGCRTNINSIENPTTIKIELQVIGGLGGIQHETSISENGEVVFKYYFKTHKYIITKILSKSQFDSLNAILDEKKIFDLNDEYRPDQPIMDNFIYKLSYYSSSRENKNVVAEGGIELPEVLKIIIEKLIEINNFVQMNSNFGTLISIWDTEEIIKNWIFKDIDLERKVYYYSEINNSDSIISYFKEIKKNVGYNILYLSRDSLYSIYDGGADYGYFNVYEVFQAKLWYNYFQENILIVQDIGISKLITEWDKMNISLNKTYIYVIDKIEDNGRAVKLKLIPGKPYNN